MSKIVLAYQVLKQLPTDERRRLASIAGLFSSLSHGCMLLEHAPAELPLLRAGILAQLKALGVEFTLDEGEEKP